MNAHDAAERLEQDSQTVKEARVYVHRWMGDGVELILRLGQPVIQSDVFRALHDVGYGVWEVYNTDNEDGLKLYAYSREKLEDEFEGTDSEYRVKTYAGQ